MSRTCIVILGSFAPDSLLGGITTHCTRLVQRLDSEQDFLVRKINIRPKIKNLRTFFAANPLYWIFRVVFLWLAGFCLFHFHTSSRGVPFLILAPLLHFLRAKILISFHSGKIGSDLLTGKAQASFFQRVFSLADTVVFMNENEVRIAAEMFPAFAGKIKAIHSFIIPDKKPVSNNTPRSNFTIATMGAWLRYYSFDDVINAAKELALAFPKKEIHLNIVAALFNVDESYKKEILALAEQTSCAVPNLKITALEDVPDTLAFFTGIDVLIRSSSVDSFGLCVAEAAFSGKPVIATNVCRRVGQTRLYAPGDTVALQAQLVEVFERIAAGTLEKIDLAQSEDAYPALRELYCNALAPIASRTHNN